MKEVKVLGICGSHRAKGATEYSVKKALEAAETVPGITTQYVGLRGKKIGHCIHCNQCIKNNCLCVIEDDFQEVQQMFLDADAYIIGSPVYQMNSTPLLQDFCSRLRPTYLVHPGHFTNRVGGAIATGGTRHGGQEVPGGTTAEPRSGPRTARLKEPKRTWWGWRKWWDLAAGWPKQLLRSRRGANPSLTRESN